MVVTQHSMAQEQPGRGDHAPSTPGLCTTSCVCASVSAVASLTRRSPVDAPSCKYGMMIIFHITRALQWATAHTHACAWCAGDDTPAVSLRDAVAGAWPVDDTDSHAGTRCACWGVGAPLTSAGLDDDTAPRSACATRAWPGRQWPGLRNAAMRFGQSKPFSSGAAQAHRQRAAEVLAVRRTPDRGSWTPCLPNAAATCGSRRPCLGV